ncbi:hypothetical protein [Sorangium sp. So ce131]|uniref:hypothetical protein n=1 Tax=Sorangium sp. So ce131 TaxID=3133282 RepID=UPI003F601499
MLHKAGQGAREIAPCARELLREPLELLPHRHEPLDAQEELHDGVGLLRGHHARRRLTDDTSDGVAGCHGVTSPRVAGGHDRLLAAPPHALALHLGGWSSSTWSSCSAHRNV